MSKKTKHNDPKRDGYRAKPINEDDLVDSIETTPEELSPDPETVVATGDEEAPIASTVHSKGLKSLYDKAKRNRDLVQRSDAENTPDVERIQRLVAEASGGDDIDSSTELDTNRPGRFEDETHTAEEIEIARLIQEDEERKVQEAETESESDAADALPEPGEESIVEVVVLGRTYQVPQQDIDDAGGLSAYQKNRAATIRLGRAATAEHAAQAKLREIEEQQRAAQQSDPSEDGQDEADVDSLYEGMMDVVVDGDKDEIKGWLADKVKPAPLQPEPAAPTQTDEPPVTETQEELNRQFEVERVEANTMMHEEFPIIMDDPSLLGLAQQRFQVIRTDPSSEGRSQKEMAREAARYVQGIAGKLKARPKPDPIEQERQMRVERKRSLPQSSRADSKAPSRAVKKRQVPSAREHLARLRRHSGQDLELE